MRYGDKGVERLGRKRANLNSARETKGEGREIIETFK